MSVLMRMVRRPDEDDLCSRDGESLTLCGEDTMVRFKGDGINWEIPLSQIQSLTTEIKKNDGK